MKGKIAKCSFFSFKGAAAAGTAFHSQHPILIKNEIYDIVKRERGKSGAYVI
jgi:hypothetical protein